MLSHNQVNTCGWRTFGHGPVELNEPKLCRKYFGRVIDRRALIQAVTGMERGERKQMESGNETGIEAETESDAILLNQRLGF